MDIMRHKDAVDDIVKTGKSIMNSKTPEEKEMLKVGYIFTVMSALIMDKCARKVKYFGPLSGKDPESLGGVRRRQSAEL